MRVYEVLWDTKSPLSYACKLLPLKQLLITLFLLPLLLWLLPTCPLLLPSSKAAFSWPDNFMGMMSFLQSYLLVWHWWFMGSVQYWLNSNKKWRVTDLTFNSGAIPPGLKKTKRKKKLFFKRKHKSEKKHWLFIDKSNLFFWQFSKPVCNQTTTGCQATGSLCQ